MIKPVSALLVSMFLCAGMAQAASPGAAPDAKTADCEKQAAEKKLAGAAKNSFVKKCGADGATATATAKAPAAEACEKQAAEKKLAGAAKNSFVKKCSAEAK
jgi:hypothetical protein